MSISYLQRKLSTLYLYTARLKSMKLMVQYMVEKSSIGIIDFVKALCIFETTIDGITNIEKVIKK